MIEGNFLLSPLPMPDLLEQWAAQTRAIIRDELQRQREADQQVQLLTTNEAADFLKVSKVTLWDWEKRGRIIKHKIGGKVYFKRAELMASMGSLQRYKKPQHGRAVV